MDGYLEREHIPTSGARRVRGERPIPIPPKDVLSNALPEAWSDNTATALAIANALSTKARIALPWYTVREAIDSAIRSRWFETTADSGQ